MRLSNIEFKAMNNPVRRFFQKHLEFRNFRWMGLTETNKDFLEIGCGSGYGAVLLSTLKPRSYIGIDLMPEQIALTGKWDLPGYVFKTMDASDMKAIPADSKDIIVIFGILHHIPKWREVIQECRRVLRNSGRLFVEEPEGKVIRNFDRFFKWGHAVSDFSLPGFEEELANNDFTIIRKRNILGFGTYHAQKNSSTKEALS
jgi:ubiquinone/menaquinone biosynthesis C-methylase UbiE